MKTKITTALAVLLLAGTSTTVLAQERDHERGGGHRDGGVAPAPQPQAAPQAAPQPAAQAPQGGGRGHWAGPSTAGGQPHFEHTAPPAGAAPQAVQPRFDRGGDQRFNREGGRPWEGRPADGRQGDARQWNRDRAPREVTPPPPVAGRTWDGARDGRVPGAQVERRDGRTWDGARDGRTWDGAREGRDNRWGDRDGRWANGDRSGASRWQPGRFPPVYQSQRRYRLGAYRAPYGYYARTWGFGEFLPRGWYDQDYWLDDFLDYGLPYPPPGYEWVRVGPDALLVDRFTGRIVQVVRWIFW